MARIVIIGGGLTGLSVAYHLEQQGFHDYLLFEKEKELGGLCRSMHQDGFTIDYTGHLLHMSDPYFRKFIDAILGFEQLCSIDRRSYIYLKNIYAHYPIQTNLFGLPSEVVAECIEEFLARPKSKGEPKNYRQWVLAHFGAGLAKHFFFPFQQKIFDYDLTRVTHRWTGRFVPSTSLKQMIEGAVYDRGDVSVGYNSHFYYPRRGGIAAMINGLAQKIERPQVTGCTLKSVDVKTKTVHFQNGHAQSYDHLITTMPLPELLKRMNDTSTLSLASLAPKLVANSVVNFNFGIKRERLSEKHWIYFPESKYPFYRMGFPNNFSADVVPSGYSSLYGECAFTKKSKRYMQQMTSKAVDQAKQFFAIKDHEIVMQNIVHIPYAYVLYTHWREANIAKIHQRLHEHNIYSIGRYGEWKYSSMQEAVLDGKKIADSLTSIPTYKPTVIATYPTIKEKTI